MKFFGTDGIRGKAYDSLPLLRAYQLGFAIKSLYVKQKVVIGYDTRESSVDFVNALLSGLNDVDYEVAGIVTTPVIAYYSNIKSCIGIMITASHNPYYDNGLKVFNKGFKINDEEKKSIEKKMIEKSTYNKSITSYQINSNAKNQYIQFVSKLNLKNTFNDYVVDAANGSASYLAKELFDEKIYFNNPNGKNINENCGCTNIEVINKNNNDKRVAFSFDGDGDRLLMTIDKKILSGDEIMYLIAKDLLNKEKKPKIACSIMTNPGSVKAFQKLGIKIIETNVGDTYLMEEIKKGNADIGFESSGHFILNYENDLLLGDGLLVAKTMIDIFSRYNLSGVRSWLEEIELSPMKTENLKLEKKRLNNIVIKECINKIIKTKSIDDKIIIRPSGTEELIRVTVGMEDSNKLDETMKEIKKCIMGGKE